MAAVKKKTTKKKVAKKKAVKKKGASRGRRNTQSKSSPDSITPPTPGRPSDFTPELGEEICSRMMEGNSLRKVCQSDDMPDKKTVFRWLARGTGENAPVELSEFCHQYARACEIRRDYRFDELEEELEEKVKTPLLVNGLPLQVDGKLVLTMTTQSVSFGKLMLDAFKWQASKENPKKYGEKIQAEHSGNIGLTQILADIDGKSTGLPSDNGAGD